MNTSGFEFPVRNTLARVWYKAGLDQKIVRQSPPGPYFLYQNHFFIKKTAPGLAFCSASMLFPKFRFLEDLTSGFYICRAPLGHLWAVIAHLFSWVPHFVAAFS